METTPLTLASPQECTTTSGASALRVTAPGNCTKMQLMVSPVPLDLVWPVWSDVQIGGTS